MKIYDVSIWERSERDEERKRKRKSVKRMSRRSRQVMERYQTWQLDIKIMVKTFGILKSRTENFV